MSTVLPPATPPATIEAPPDMPAGSIQIDDPERADTKPLRQFVMFTHSFLLLRAFTAVWSGVQKTFILPAVEHLPVERLSIDAFGLGTALFLALVGFYLVSQQIHAIARYRYQHFFYDIGVCLLLFIGMETVPQLEPAAPWKEPVVWSCLVASYAMLGVRLKTIHFVSAAPMSHAETKFISRAMMERLKVLRDVAIAFYVTGIVLGIASWYFSRPKFNVVGTLNFLVGLGTTLPIIALFLHLHARRRGRAVWQGPVFWALAALAGAMIALRGAGNAAIVDPILRWRYQVPLGIVQCAWCLLLIVATGFWGLQSTHSGLMTKLEGIGTLLSGLADRLIRSSRGREGAT